MERSFFTSRSPGKPIRVKKNKWAFCPDPLPSTLNPDWRISTALPETEREIGRVEGRLAGCSDFTPPIQKIFLFQEALAAFTIEKTKVSAESHFLPLILESDDKGTQRDCISLYINAYNNGLKYLEKGLPPSLDLILTLYSQVFQGDAAPDSEPAGFREKTGDPARGFSLTGQEFQYIPPPEPQMKTALYSLDKRFRHGTNIPRLIDISLIYYQFMATQPLAKGNMAVACLLSDLLLATSLETRTIPIPLAPFFQSNLDEFSACFFQVIKTGDWAEWIAFFLKGITQQSIKARKTASTVLALCEDYRKRLENERVSAALSQLADDVFLNPFITVNHASRLARVTFRAAQFNVDKLVDLGILKETTGRKRNRVYTAPGVIELYES
jgi:Fic family protein